MAQGADRGLGRGSGLAGGKQGADHGAVVPVESLGDERNGLRATAAEEDRVDLDALPVVVLRSRGRALSNRDAVTRVRVSGLAGRLVRTPLVAEPVDEVLRRVAAHALPPDVAVIGERNVGEQRVAGLHGLHGDRVGVVGGARRDAEEAVFRVDGVQAVFAQVQPRDVVAHDLCGPARDGRGDHGEVGLTAGRREGSGDVVGLASRVGELEDKHVLGHPSLFLRHDGSDTQGVALLGEDGVSAVAGTVGPDFLGLRELGDVLGLVARPDGVFLARLERGTHGVERVDEVAVGTDLVQGFLAHAGHDAHGKHDVGGVSELNAELRLRIVDGAHAERHDVHRAALHGATEGLGHLSLHLGRVHPVIGRAGVLFLLRADEGAGLDAGDVRRVGAREEGVRTLLLIELNQSALLYELGREAVSLFLGAVHEDHALRLEKLDRLANPRDELFILGRNFSNEATNLSGHSLLLGSSGVGKYRVAATSSFVG